jgi:hypothetical protein
MGDYTSEIQQMQVALQVSAVPQVDCMSTVAKTCPAALLLRTPAGWGIMVQVTRQPPLCWSSSSRQPLSQSHHPHSEAWYDTK